MPIMYRWFVQMNVSNRQQHIHLNNRDARGFSDCEDARLYWLELSVLGYTEHLKEASSQDNFPSKETYHALVFNAVSNIFLMSAAFILFTLQSFQLIQQSLFWGGLWDEWQATMKSQKWEVPFVGLTGRWRLSLHHRKATWAVVRNSAPDRQWPSLN